MSRRMNTGTLSDFFENTGTYHKMTKKEQEFYDRRDFKIKKK
tara:strand:+ start:421 stop:546 length:126 start_codon:yes stop_codon:yes gene_type:complete